MIKKYYTGGPWEDVLGEDNNSSNYIKLTDPNAKLSKPGGIKLNNLWNNFNIKLKDSNGGMNGFIQNHPYLKDTVHGAVAGATMLLNNKSQRQMKQTQRDYLNNPFNLYQTTTTKKYGSRPWLDSTAQFTDFPNEKVPVFEPGYQNSAYINPMATAKKGGQLYMTFQGGGATNQMGAGSSLPKYEMGAGSPVQQALLRDSQHYGLPTAKDGGFFTPEKLTGSTENEELYNKPNNFLNYLRDMSANTVVQNSLGRRRKGQLTDEQEMGMAQMGMQAPQEAAPQQGGNQQEQLIQMVAQALQQGASPEEVMQKLVEMGLPEDQAMQVVQMVAEQLEGSNQEDASQEMPQESQEQAPQGMEQQMAQGMQQQMPMAQLGMGGGGGDFEEFGFNDQNPLNPYYQNLYDPSEAKQVNASLMEGLHGAAQGLFSQPMDYFKGKQADAQAKLDELQKYTTPKAQRGGMMSYQTNGQVKQPSFYDDAIEQYKWFTENPESWQGDPDMTNEDGSLNLCIDCLNVDWNNPDHIQGITRLVEEGLSKGPHMEQNHNMYMSKLKEFGLPEPKMQQKKTMKRGGMTRFQTKGITKPTATDAAGFEKWYNETMGKLLSDPSHTQADIKSFMDMAGNWASDAKLDRNQLQDVAQNPLTYTTQIPHKNSPGYATSTRQRMTRDNQDKYQQEYLDILKKFDTDYETAAANNKIVPGKNPGDAAILDPTIQLNLETDRDKALQALEKKYPTKVATDQDFFYSKPGAAATTTTTTPGTTTTTGPGGYQFNPAMQKMLGLMAQGYTKAPLFGFRTNRNINALFNQTMADMMLKGQGQGQGTASATGTTIPGAPAVGPDGAYNTWIKDNNINRFDIIPGRNGVKMKIRANQPGQGTVQYDSKGNIVNTGNGGPGDPNDAKNFDPFRTGNFNPYARGTTPDELTPNYTRLTSTYNPTIGYADKNFLEKARNRMATNRLERLGSNLDQLNQKEQYLTDNEEKGYGPANLDSREFRQKNRMSNRYSKIANRFNKQNYTAPEHGFETGGQYKEGGTYYLSDEEIQALMDAGYELE